MGFQMAVTCPCLQDLGRNFAIRLLENCIYFTRFLVVRYLSSQFLFRQQAFGLWLPPQPSMNGFHLDS